MELYSGTTLQKEMQTETMPNGKQHFQLEIHSVDETEGAQLEDAVRYDNLILNRDYCLELTFPQEWEEAVPEYSVEILTMTAKGALEYQAVEFSEEALQATYTKDAEKHELELKIGEKLPQAGTYRLNINWSYKGICFMQTQNTFFINYSVHLNKDLSSQGVQIND